MMKNLLCLKGMIALFLFSSALWAQENAQRTCSIELTQQPPFFISNADGQGMKDWENFRSRAEGGQNSISHFISKGSVVRQIRPDGNSGAYLAVEVLSHAQPNQALLRGRFKENAASSHFPQAQTGEKGFIYRGSLEAAEDYVFVINQDTEFFALPAPFSEARAFMLSTKEGKFEVNRCCDAENACEDFPLFKVMLENEWSQEQLSLDHGAQVCQVLTGTRPVRKNQFESIFSLLSHPGLGLGDRLVENRAPIADDLFYIDARGFVMLPHVVGTGRDINLQGPYGSVHYTGSGGSIGEQFGEDSYLSPWAACGFMALLREWQRRYPDCDGKGCGISWGNCSHANYVGQTRSRGNLVWPHSSHTHGHCIDLRLMSKTAELTGVNVNGGGAYDRERTVEMIRLAQNIGATTIFLQDARASRMARPFTEEDMAPILTHVPPHKDHVHICFSHRLDDQSNADPRDEANNQRLINACTGDAKAASEGRPFEMLSEDKVPRQ